MIRILVAMEREAKSLGVPCEVIGIGGTDIPEIKPDDIVVNVGYCGGYKVPVGTIIEPLVSIDASSWWTEVLDQHFDCQKAACFSAKEFVTEPLTDKPAVYDMELSDLASVKCAGLYCLKIVSDNLDESDCESYNDEKAWEQVRTLLKGEKLI